MSEHTEHRALAFEAIDALYTRSSAAGRQGAVRMAASAVVAAAIYLESTIGEDRTRRMLLAAAEAVGTERKN